MVPKPNAAEMAAMTSGDISTGGEKPGGGSAMGDDTSVTRRLECCPKAEIGQPDGRLT